MAARIVSFCNDCISKGPAERIIIDFLPFFARIILLFRGILFILHKKHKGNRRTKGQYAFSSLLC